MDEQSMRGIFMANTNPRLKADTEHRGKSASDKAEDAGGLAPVKDDNAV